MKVDRQNWQVASQFHKKTHSFDVGQLDLLEPLGERGRRQNLLKRVDREDVAAVGQAAKLGLAVADGHRGSALHALVAEQVAAAGTETKRDDLSMQAITPVSSALIVLCSPNVLG